MLKYGQILLLIGKLCDIYIFQALKFKMTEQSDLKNLDKLNAYFLKAMTEKKSNK